MIRVSFDRTTGSMTAGTVPLARIGYVGNVTFTSITDGSSTFTDVAHSLGTDNVMAFLMTNIKANNVQYGVRRTDGYMSDMSIGSITTLYAGAANPASGNVRVYFRNESGGTITVTLRICVLIES